MNAEVVVICLEPLAAAPPMTVELVGYASTILLCTTMNVNAHGIQSACVCVVSLDVWCDRVIVSLVSEFSYSRVASGVVE